MRHHRELQSAIWPTSRLPEALEHAAVRGSLAAPSPRPPDLGGHDGPPHEWIDAAAAQLQIEVEPLQVTLQDLDDVLRRAAPALLRPSAAGTAADEAGFLLLLRGGRHRATLLNPELQEQRVATAALRAHLIHRAVQPSQAAAEDLLERIGVPSTQRAHVRDRLLGEYLHGAVCAEGWLLRAVPSAHLPRTLRLSGVLPPAVVFLTAYLALLLLQLAAWALLGRSLLQPDDGDLWSSLWAMLLLSMIPFQLLTGWSQGYLTIAVGAIVKQRLLYGALHLQPDTLRTQGIGQFLGRVMDADIVESSTLQGGLQLLVAVMQLITALLVLSQGAVGPAHAAALTAVLLLVVGFSILMLRGGRRAAQSYRTLTNHLVERMIGHRTRLVQEAPEQRHHDEDRELSDYLLQSRTADRVSSLSALLPGSWFLLGLALLLPLMISANGTATATAVSLGGVLLAYQAMNGLHIGLQNMIQLSLAWQQVQPLWQHGATPPAAGYIAASPAQPAADAAALLTVRGLSYRYRPTGRAVLHNLDLRIDRGERLLLEGASGGGKSTLAALLAGLRRPDSGLLLLNGLDRATIGDAAWRRRIVAAPQFHENHIFNDTFAFNLLLGRHWPPTAADLQEAEAICTELGLDNLLRSMPAGWQQMLGDSGWQLSHGERSRVFIARALLQRADLLIFDESFGALDPETLTRALDCVRRRSLTLLVIAHP